MVLIDDTLLDKICEEAKESPRLRMNYNLHKSLDSGAQKLLNALQPGSVFPIHRHNHTAETYIVLRGSIRVFLYEDDGSLLSEHLLDPCDGNYGLEIPVGRFHSLEVLDRNTVIFEAKEGPYTPLLPEDILDSQKK
ncbi:MAG: WbuC family cupin fold metalloprotein [Bacteroidales bacterium]|jgi:cupin fold WbuC family metalloprotein|nr:WbuC family cupin fold metalloprotein [Bacteroidales bacterium]